MKALLTSIFSYLFRRNSTPPAGPANTTEVASTLDFALLNQREQEAVRQYFFAAVNLMQLINGIRQRHRAVDVDSVLTDFRQAERSFIWAGMRPIFPPGVQCMASFDTAWLISTGMLARFDPAERVIIYSPAMDRYVAKLIVQYRAHELDSRSYNPLA